MKNQGALVSLAGYERVKSMSGEVSPAARVMHTCASAIEESLVALIEMGEDGRAERCKHALVALVGEDFGAEYAAHVVVEAHEVTGRDFDDYERLQRVDEMGRLFASEMERLGDAGDFLDRCDESEN